MGLSAVAPVVELWFSCCLFVVCRQENCLSFSQVQLVYSLSNELARMLVAQLSVHSGIPESHNLQ